MANYTQTNWSTGDLITADKMNKIENQLGLVTPGATNIANNYTAGNYAVGDYCIYNGQLYRCTVTGAGTPPTGWVATTVMDETGSGVSDGIAQEFSTLKTYAVGDYVVFEGGLYRCTTSVTTAGTWQSSNWTAAILADDIKHKAEIDGAYEDMTVGNAEQLVGMILAEDRVPYKFRTSGGSADIGNRETNIIVGGTMTWNQLVQNGNFTNLSNWTFQDSSASVSDNIATIVPNSTASQAAAVQNKKIDAHIYIGWAHVMNGSTSGRISLQLRDGTAVRTLASTAYRGFWTTLAGIVNGATVNNNGYVRVLFPTVSTTEVEFKLSNFNVIDLTQMFGSEIADYLYTLEQTTPGAGVAWFKKLFPEDYYEYNPGELLSVEGLQSHDMVGLNQFDGEVGFGNIDVSGQVVNERHEYIHSNNFTRVFPGTTYCLYAENSEQFMQLYVIEYDSNKNLYSRIGIITGNSVHTSEFRTFTTSLEAAFIKVLMYKNEVFSSLDNARFCFNLSWSGYCNGEYEPYKKYSYPLDSTLTLRGIPQLDASGNLYYDGDIYESDGTVTRKYGIVDLGTLNWIYATETQRLYTTGIESTAKSAESGTVVANMICPIYLTDTEAHTASHFADKLIAIGTTGFLYVYDSTYTDAATFKAAMDGVMLVYELAEPTTETADPYQNPQVVDDFGTEEYVTDSIVPVGHQTQYMANLRDKVQHLPDLASANGDYIVRQVGSQMSLVPAQDAIITINPKQFGAKADITYDDTEALSNTFNHSNVVIEGGNLQYKLTELTMTECNNVLIRNFQFYHGISMTLKHCTNIIFENCTWDEFQDNGIPDKNVQCVILTTMHTGSAEWTEANNWRMDEICKNITFDHCKFIGTHFTENTPSLYVNTKPHYNTGMCLRLEGVDGLRVVDCYFTQNRGNACIQQNCQAPLGDYEITNNFFYLNCWGGIELYRYTGTSSYPTRFIHNNRFIGHGLGYLPWSYLERFEEKNRGVGTAALLGGNTARIQNEPAYCSVCNNHFEDNNESSVEGWQWNPVKNNVIIGNGVLQTPESVAEMKAKYKIDYDLYVRINPSQNPIYIGQYDDVQRYADGEARVVENNTIGRMYGSRNPIMIRGYFYEPVIIRNNTMTDAELYVDENAKYAHFLGSTFYKGVIWENNIGMKPYFNSCTFSGGEYRFDDLQDIYNCTFTSQNFESTSTIDRFQNIRSARFNQEYASLRDNDVSSINDGKPTLGFKKVPVEVDPGTPDWTIKDEEEYNDGYVCGGELNPTVLDTGMALGETDQDWSIFVDTTTSGDNNAGNNTYLIKLLTFSDGSGAISLEFGSRYTDEVCTTLFTNGYYGYDTIYRIDSGTYAFLRPGNTSQFILRHKAGSESIEVFAIRAGTTATSINEIKRGTVPFVSGTAGTLQIGGAPNNNQPKSYYNGTIHDACVYEKYLSDAQVSMLMLGEDITPRVMPEPAYDIANESGYISGTGLTMDGTTAINTGIPLLENTNDFTIITRFKFDNMTADGERPNFTFIPVFSAMSAEMAPEGHVGYTDKGIDLGLTLQNGVDMSALARGGFIHFRRDWRYTNNFPIDMYNYTTYPNNWYMLMIQRKNGVITLYDNNLIEIGQLTGAYANSIVNGNLTIGARMGYDPSSYTDYFKGVISDFRVFDSAVDLDIIEEQYPSIMDNAASKKGAVTYHLYNKNNKRKSARYALVELNYDLGAYNAPEYSLQYPKAFGIRMDEIHDDILWVPCGSSKRIVFTKLCKWSAVYDPFESWDIEIINPGTVPNMNVKIEGIKVLLLSRQEAVPNTVDATDFNISWENDLSTMTVGSTVNGYLQYFPDEATSGLTFTIVPDDPDVVSISVSGQEITITGLSIGETMIHVNIPYGTEHVYNVTVAQLEY